MTICLLLLAAVSRPSWIQAQEITFTETQVDWGTIREEAGVRVQRFHFTNTGDKPLLIKNVLTSCGCTSAEWSKTEYQPGATGSILVTYHPEGRIETDINLVTEVYTNSPKRGTVNLEIFGKVKRNERKDTIAFYRPEDGKRVSHSSRQPSDEFEIILERIRQEIYHQSDVSKTDRETALWLSCLTEKGGWNDVDYACYFRTNWDPNIHLRRLKTIATAYTDSRSAYCGNAVLFKAVKDALAFWVKCDPKSHNWWHNQIAAPQLQAELLALMDNGREKLPDEVVHPILEMMKQRSNPRKWTGANKMDIAVHHLIRGCLLKNDSIVRTNADEIFYPVQIVKAEGIQKDMSYHQHGAQLYIGGYGAVFIGNVTRMGNILKGTSYAMSDEKLKLFSDFTRNTYLNVFRGRHLDFSVTGRGVSRTGTLDYGTCAPLFQSLQSLDSEHADEYATIAHRFLSQDASYGRSERNVMYYCSDYMLHNRKKFDFSIRTASVRTQKTESGNGENLFGTYMSDGATNIRVNGNEYTDIFPVWEWDKIPGTTVPAGEKRNPADWGTKGTCTFTGGVSDGQHGVMTFAMDDYGVQARKSWFVLGDEIVCLGAGITSELPEEIVTTVNQCHLDGEVWTMSGNNSLHRVTETGTIPLSSAGWIWHDSIAYYFPQETALRLRTGHQQGSWSKINFNYSAAELSMPVFNLTIAHGITPKQTSYAYILVPGIYRPEELKDYPIQNIRIERNDSQIQAVSHLKAGILQVVFHEPGVFSNEWRTIEARKACVIQVTMDRKKVLSMQMTDPATQEELREGTDVIVK